MDVAATHALVLDVLNRASSQDPLVLKPAELKLREWEIVPGFYNILCVSIYFWFTVYDPRSYQASTVAIFWKLSGHLDFG